jgi:DNA (cytosine-5)-methyltransferase 1
MSHRFPYRWNLADGYPADRHGLTVFSTFACGGGSTMGYKLAGYDVLGCLEIDPQIIEVYRRNHHPALAYCEDIRHFRTRDDLPPELFELDILDGSPPCSSFSTSGNRDKDWGKDKHFREGQTKQRLDDLFFDFIALAAKLQPRVVIAENVKGMIVGKAKGYAKEVKREMEAAGYRVQLFLLNAASMGVPQKRERVFFVGIRNDLDAPPLRLVFNEPAIPYGTIREDGPAQTLTGQRLEIWKHRLPDDRHFGYTSQRMGIGVRAFDLHYADEDEPLKTITASRAPIRRDLPQEISRPEAISAGTFPRDYDFGTVDPKYLIGMSVPPVMVAQIATAIREQWLTPAFHLPSSATHARG